MPKLPFPDPRSDFVLDLRQREIHELLELIGPEPAAYFSDACRIMDGAAGVTAQTHLAAHLLREIEGRIHEVLEPMLSGDAKQRISDAGKDKESHRAKITEAAEILGLDAPATEQWIEYALELHGFAHRYSLAGARHVAEFRDHFASGQSVLLGVLRAFRAIYVNARPVLAELAATRNPTNGHLKRLRRRVPHSTVALGEFFSLATLDWFPLLREAGYFSNPRPVEVDEEGRFSYVEWPPARFLVRAAAVEELQPHVVEILNRLDTNNPEARDATVEAALAMPASRAAEVAPKIAANTADSDIWWTPRHSEELVTHLVDGGEIAAALEVTRPLLASAPRGADWRMRHAFTDLVPKLFPAAGLEGLVLLRDLLAEELTAEGRERRNDLSTIWREMVAGGPDFQRRDLLVTALNAAADSLVTNDAASLRDVVDTLTADARAIFSRLALHLIAQDADPEIAAEWLGSEEVFRDFNLDREYAELAQQSFRSLPPEVRERIFGWIEHGPTWRPRDLTDEEVPVWDDGWRLRMLRRLPELPEEWQRRNDELVEQLGEPEDPLTRRRHAVWSGTRSPISKQELLELSDDEILEFLDTWQPDGDWRGPSVEGLASELRDAAIEAPRRVSELLPAFAGREPTYARSVVSGLDQAARGEAGGGDIAWRAVFRFARDILELPAEIDGRDPVGDELDPGWERSRLEVSRLLVSGLARRAIPVDLSDELWPIVAALANGEDLTVQVERPREPEGTDDETATFYSGRGTAIEAVIQFAWWLQQVEEAGDAETGMPERVRNVLERHLDPDGEQTRAVLSVFGRYFNLLYTLDPSWTTEHATAIFPDEPEQRGRDAAWRAFISNNRFWRGSWDILEPQYRQAVEELADERFEEEEVTLFDETGVLLMHVLIAYLDGLVDLADDSLLGRFFTVAPLRLRRTFFEMIGTDISDENELPEETQEKLQRLWDWRSEHVFAEGNISELAGFGWWFGSRKLPERWSTEQLIRVLEGGGGVSFDYTVTQRLPELADTDLASAVQIVSLLVERAYTPHLVLSARDQFRHVLSTALRSADDHLVAEARATISRLYTRRHTEFNDLLG